MAAQKMLSDKLVQHLRCLESGSQLSLLGDDELQELNNAIESGNIFNRLGQRVERKLDEGLVNAEQSIVYAVFNQIPQLILDESISLDQLNGIKS